MGEVAYTTFTNQTSGTVPTVSATVTSAICQVSVSPALGTVMGPGTDFDAAWTVKNISGKTWELYTTDYKYIKGAEMQKFGDAYDLNQVVATGEKVTLTVDMLAPADPGTYSATWALVQGNTSPLHPAGEDRGEIRDPFPPQPFPGREGLVGVGLV